MPNHHDHHAGFDPCAPPNGAFFAEPAYCCKYFRGATGALGPVGPTGAEGEMGPPGPVGATGAVIDPKPAAGLYKSGDSERHRLF